MKITKRQLRRIIKENTSFSPMKSIASAATRQTIKQQRSGRAIVEANPDGTVSADEEDEEHALMSHIEGELADLMRMIDEEAERIGGGFRSPGIKARALRLLADVIHDYR